MKIKKSAREMVKARELVINTLNERIFVVAYELYKRNKNNPIFKSDFFKKEFLNLLETAHKMEKESKEQK